MYYLAQDHWWLGGLFDCGKELARRKFSPGENALGTEKELNRA